MSKQKPRIKITLQLVRRTYQIRPDQDDKLKSLSLRTGAPEAWHVREALDQYFKMQT